MIVLDNSSTYGSITTENMTSDATMAPPPPPKRQARSPNQKASGGTTPPISQAEKYQLAYMDAWTKLPKWKQLAIEEDRRNGVDGRMMTEFLHEVERLAEQD